MITKKKLHDLIDQIDIREFNYSTLNKETSMGDFILTLEIGSEEIVQHIKNCILPF